MAIETDTRSVYDLDLNIANNAWQPIVTDGWDEVSFQHSSRSGTFGTTVLSIERSMNGVDWENPSGGASAIGQDSATAVLTVEAPLMRVRVSTAAGGACTGDLHCYLRRTT